MTPRPYQHDAISAINAGWRECSKQLLVLPTGGGKTIIFAHLAAANPGRTLILCHREELIDQAVKKLHAATGIRAAREKAEHHAHFDERVVVGSIQTLSRPGRRLRWPKDHFSLIVCDEAHHVLSDSWRLVLAYFDASARVLGVTATPDRGDRRNLGAYFERAIDETNLFDLVNGGYLAPIAVHSVPLEIDLSSVKSSAGDYDSGDLGHALEPYLDEIGVAIARHAPFRRVLGFCPLIETSRKAAQACERAGLKSDWVSGEDPDRALKLERFAAWDIDVLWNAMLLLEGYDDPGIDCVVMLRPTRSRPLYAQAIGRGTRIAPGKSNLLLLDFLWHHQRHKLCRPADLIAKSDEEAEVITQLSQQAGNPEIDGPIEMDLQGLANSATRERENALRKKLAEQRGKKAKVLSAEEFALEHNRLDVAEYEPTLPWETKEISEAQQWTLKRAKIDLETIRGRGHASQLIGMIKQQERGTLATHKVRFKMKQMGYPNWETASVAEGKKFFADLRKGVTA